MMIRRYHGGPRETHAQVAADLHTHEQTDKYGTILTQMNQLVEAP